jgi:hypothetical protein
MIHMTLYVISVLKRFGLISTLVRGLEFCLFRLMLEYSTTKLTMLDLRKSCKESLVFIKSARLLRQLGF